MEPGAEMNQQMLQDVENATRNARDRFKWLHVELRDRICFLDYAPGTRLSETALAEEFGISRTPLRRVLARLEDEGLVRSVHGVGTLVTDVDLDELSQVYRLRMELAALTAQLDPVAPTPQLIDAFRSFLPRCEALQESRSHRDFTRINRDFFDALLRLTGNEPLRAISERLYYRTARIWLQSVLSSHVNLQQEIEYFGKEVRDITAAVELGDVSAAANLRRAHISMSFARLRGQGPDLQRPHGQRQENLA